MTTLQQALLRPLTDFDWPAIARNLSRAAVILTWQAFVLAFRAVYRVAYRASLALVWLPFILAFVLFMAATYLIEELLHFIRTGEFLLLTEGMD